MKDDAIHRGGCLCGGVRYRTLGQPERTTICHCSFCQKLTGSAFLVDAVFLRPRVEIEKGRVCAYNYVSPDHGRTLTIHFCGRCGTNLSLTFERFPAMQGVFGGTFDDPSWLRPSRHIFTEKAVPWMVFPRGIDCFTRHAMKLDGSPEMPWRAMRSGRRPQGPE